MQNMTIGARPLPRPGSISLIAQTPLVVRHAVVDFTLDDHLLPTVVAVQAVAAAVFLVVVVLPVVGGDGGRVGGKALLGPEGRRVGPVSAAHGVGRSVARLGFGVGGGGGDGGEFDFGAGAWVPAVVGGRGGGVLGSGVGGGGVFVDGDEGPQAREGRGHGAVADLELGADDGEASGEVALGGKDGGEEVVEAEGAGRDDASERKIRSLLLCCSTGCMGGDKLTAAACRMRR